MAEELVRKLEQEAKLFTVKCNKCGYEDYAWKFFSFRIDAEAPTVFVPILKCPKCGTEAELRGLRPECCVFRCFLETIFNSFPDAAKYLKDCEHKCKALHEDQELRELLSSPEKLDRFFAELEKLFDEVRRELRELGEVD